jgi:hypothetical protein
MKLFETYKEHFINVTDKNKKLLGDINYDKYDKKFYKLDEKNLIEISKNKNLIRSEYQIIGFYNITNSIWTWVWNNPFIEKNLGINKDVLQNYVKKLINSKTIDQKELEELVYYTSNEAFYISFENIGRLLQFIMYNLQSAMVVTKKNDDINPSVIEFISIKDILLIK